MYNKSVLARVDDVLLDIRELNKFFDNIPKKDYNAIFCKVKSDDPPMRNKTIDKQ